MIEFTKAFKSGTELFASIEAAQINELLGLFNEQLNLDVGQKDVVDTLCMKIVENKDAILDILTTTATSKPKARSIHGGKKIRKSKPEAELPLEK